MNSISELLKNTIKNLYGIDFVPDVTPSPENIDADYSSNAPLKLAKELHKSPMEIAKELKESWASAPERSANRLILILIYIYQLIGARLFCFKKSLALLNGLLPKKPLWAESGEG